MLAIGVLVCATLAPAEPAPIVEVTADDTRIDASCRVRIPEGLVIQDKAGDGVIQVVADDVTIEFLDGSVLRGAAGDAPGDTLTGVGVCVDGVSGVTLRGLAVHGFKVNVQGVHADHLVVEDSDLSGAYRQRLGSTAQREDSSDWLWPHENDENQWVTNYGGALAIEESDNVTVRRVRVRDSQNGVVLDEVNDSDVYDNDCSFLSGWGIAMWRSSRNTVTRNALDFCIRGHEEGVYNRGQDSAGLLMFEQCNDNIVAENSATHCGDGIFAFGGREAIGQVPPRGGGEMDYANAGCDDNVFLRNDLSFCSAHGYEMTFSEHNLFARNRVVANGICGVWGGYSSDSEYADNYFAFNGELAYGQERGAINIEHASGNLIIDNVFEDNRVGVRLWWDDDGELLKRPGVEASDRGVRDNVIARNTFIMSANHPFALRDGERLVGIQLQNFGGGDKFGVNPIGPNEFKIEGDVGERYDLGPGVPEIVAPSSKPKIEYPRIGAVGDTKPVGARVALEGRDTIVMGEWGPWDHEGVFVRRRETSGRRHLYEFHGLLGDTIGVEGDIPAGIDVMTTEIVDGVASVGIESHTPGVHEYRVTVAHGAETTTLAGTLVVADWSARIWSWETNPLEDLSAWRSEGEQVGAIELGDLDLPFGFGGPTGVIAALAGGGLGADHFGVVASTSISLDAGTWRVRTLSDDGVRVIVDGKQLIERWDIHGPSTDQATITLDEARDVGFVVEYFENDGYATLQLEIEPAD
ncbi:MAG: right-handed parallel beta-helix repeat-containing protein [Phycisphaerales bacterium]